MDFTELRERVASSTSLSLKWFTTKAQPWQLWSLYLNAIPEAERQEYNCQACRHFIERYGGMVYITAEGAITPVCWSSPGVRHPAEEALFQYVRRQQVTGIFYTNKETVGQPETSHPPTKPFTHFYAMPSLVCAHPQKMQAEKREDFRALARSLERCTLKTAEQAVLIFEDTVCHAHRSFRIARWFLQIKQRWESNHKQHANSIWLATATAPPGWCHIRKTLLGTLLDAIQNGGNVDDMRQWLKTKVATRSEPCSQF
jgi:hypothetical protein